MELDSIDKYIHMTKLAQGVEVMFAGQPCLKITEGLDSYIWAIYPVFAKLTYGANIFEDVPYCAENFDTMEEAIADGLAKLHSLGAFVGEVDLPEDTYAESGITESVEDLDEGNVGKVTHKPINLYHKKGGFIGTTKYSPTKDHAIAAAERTYKLSPGSVIAKFDRAVKESTEALLDSILQDCRAYATKHSNSIMEAHDLSLGLYESILSEADFSGVNADAKRQGKSHEQMAAEHRKYAANMRRVGQAGLASRSEALAKSHEAAAKVNEETLDEVSSEKKQQYLDKAIPTHQKQFLGRSEVPATKQQLDKRRSSIQKVSKELTGKTHYKESVEETLDEDFIDKLKKGALIASVVGVAALSGHQAIKQKQAIGSLEKQHSVLVQKNPAKAAKLRDHINAAKEVSSKVPLASQHSVRQQHIDAAQNIANEETLDEAKALSGDAYWKSKEDAASEEKAKANRASAGIKEPEKKGRGKPTLGATVDEMKDRMRENIAAGKRPHTGFDRNEKLRILRSGAMEHPEFAGTHVKAAGRPVGTTKAAAIEKKKAEPTAFSMWAGLGKK